MTREGGVEDGGEEGWGSSKDCAVSGNLNPLFETSLISRDSMARLTYLSPSTNYSAILPTNLSWPPYLPRQAGNLEQHLQQIFLLHLIGIFRLHCHVTECISSSWGRMQSEEFFVFVMISAQCSVAMIIPRFVQKFPLFFLLLRHLFSPRICFRLRAVHLRVPSELDRPKTGFVTRIARMTDSHTLRWCVGGTYLS